MKKFTLLIVLGLALVACGTDGGDPEGVAELPGEPVCIPEGTETPAPEYIGLTEEEAVELAEEQGLTVREVGRDGECHIITMDLRDDRINLEYVDGIVVGAAIF
jgi:hypothetical protein